ncbi:MAG: S46 family peptidase [Candidatus Longimicrobiales bacterium M2_2A_002]
MFAVSCRRLLGAAFLATMMLPAFASHATAQAVEVDTIPERFDFGKMWTYEYPPMEYFTETYGFDADQAWFDRVRMSVLRVPGCSASFVSPNGLVATNHHCVRGRIPTVAREGESLLDNGFYATTLDEERRIPGYYADRLIAARDVSAEVLDAMDAAATPEERRRARSAAIGAVQDRLRAEFGDAVHVEVRALYHGGRYSAYVFRRFDDVRLVAAVELQAGFFGGDPDNFTYPRYALDFAFLRVYDDDGEPFESAQHLGWSLEGVDEGSTVFVVGNPGSTNRLLTMAQLELLRDVITPVTVRALGDRLDAMRAFYAENPEVGEAMDLRNTMFSYSNSLKAYSGRLDALRTPSIMTRKRIAQERFVDSIQADPELRAEFGSVIDSIAAIQTGKRELADRYGAFRLITSSVSSPAVLRRGVIAARMLEARQAGDEARADTLARQLTAIRDLPASLEHAMLTIQLADFLRYLGPESGIAAVGLREMTPQEAATSLLEASTLATRVATEKSVESALLEQDIAVRLAQEVLPQYQEFATEWNRLSRREDDLAGELGRARFEVYGTRVPPDGTSSPRITDGVVRPYDYNGTRAPVYTTFYGMYDHYYSYGDGTDWELPRRWLPAPAGLDLETPLNFISTADTYGGNSGSPAVTPDVRMVGLNFDRNIEGLSRDFIYLPEQGRNIMVDVRAITEALDDVYDADRIVEELVTGRLVSDEADADEAVRQ